MTSETMMIAVPFHDETVWAVDRAGDVFVALKPIVESLGLDWKSQRKRVARTAVLAKAGVIMTPPSPGGPQETLCLPLKLIPGWLFGIETTRVKPAIREKLERYQAECFEVLWNHFRGAPPETPTGRLPNATEAHQAIEANLHDHQLRVLAAIKAYGDRDIKAMIDSTGLSSEAVKRATYLLWWMGIVESRDEGGITRLRVVPVDQRPAARVRAKG